MMMKKTTLALVTLMSLPGLASSQSFLNLVMTDFQRIVEEDLGLPGHEPAVPIVIAAQTAQRSPSQYDAVLEGAFQALSQADREKVQEQLKKEGFYRSTIDGLWGTGTRRALEGFNRAQVAAEYSLNSAADAEHLLRHILSLGEPDVYSSSGAELPSGYLGLWVTSPERCEYGADLAIEMNDGHLTVSEAVYWSSRHVEVVPDHEGYLLKGWGYSEGVRTNFELKVQLSGKGKLIATGLSTDTEEDSAVLLKCRDSSPNLSSPSAMEPPSAEISPAARPTGSWEDCQQSVIDALRDKGLREMGSETAYLGASDDGASGDILEECGHQPMTRQLCDTIYKETYQSCLAGGASSDDVFKLNMMEYREVRYVDPGVLDLRKLESMCTSGKNLTRGKFGILFCGE